MGAAKVNQNITKLSNGLLALKVIIAECFISWSFFFSPELLQQTLDDESGGMS